MTVETGEGPGTAYQAVPGVPDVEDVKSWLGPAANAVTSDELDLMLASAIEAQAGNHRVDNPMQAPLAEAILRRVAKAVASKGLPLGMIIGDYEYQGPATVRRWDAEIAEREDRYYIHTVA